MRKGITLTLQALLGLFMVYTAYTLFAWTPEVVTQARDALDQSGARHLQAGARGAGGG
jgi:hypothetical protein